MHKITCFILLILFFLALVPDLQAPEITGRDIFGFDPYLITEDGAIVDSNGAVRGWMHGNTVYDPQWNIKYHIRGNRLCRVEEDLKM